MQACNCTSWASICAVIAPCLSRSQAENTGFGGVVGTKYTDSRRCYKVADISFQKRKREAQDGGLLATACAPSPDSLHLASRGQSHVGTQKGRPRGRAAAPRRLRPRRRRPPERRR